MSGARSLLIAVASALGVATAAKALLLIATGAFGVWAVFDIVAGFWNGSVLLWGGGALLALTVDLALSGWARSSLRRLLVAPGDSARGDLFYLFFALSGGMAATTTLLSGGLADWACGALDAHSERGLLREANVWIAAPLLYFAMTFFNYWNHRLLHTRWLWGLHAVHHSAHEFTVINATRVSPMEVAIVSISQAIPAALLGASPEALFAASMIASFEVLWTHSNVPGFEWLERIGLSSPRAHTLHHARDARFHDRNFGDLVLLWDQLFGTYLDSRRAPDDLAMGVEGEGHACRRPVRDFLRVHRDWMRERIRSTRLLSSLPATFS